MGSKLSQPNTQKNIQSGQNSQLRYTCVSMQGWQRQMENSVLCKINIDSNSKNGNSLFAIFDGFRGNKSYDQGLQVSYFLKETFLSVLVNSQPYLQGNYEQALRHSFEKVDELIRTQKGQKRLKQIRAQNNGEAILQNEIISDNTGSTASIVLLTKKKIFTAQVGNSKICLVKDSKTFSLSQTQKPDSFDEKLRIERAGGQVMQGRINGNIKVSRALGMNSFKKNLNLSWDQQIITVQPQIKTFDKTVSDNFMLMGCEGIWQNYFKQTELVNKAKQLLQEKKDDLTECLKNVLDQSIASVSESQSDLGFKNMTAILIKFNQV